MNRIICPICRSVIALDERDQNHDVECPRCLSQFDARTADAAPGRPIRDDWDRPPRRGGEGGAIWSIILGVGAMLLAPCCGFGALLGFAGFFLGYAALQSRLRGAGIFGMAASLTGIIFSVAVLALLLLGSAEQNKPLPPKPNGTRAPFQS